MLLRTMLRSLRLALMPWRGLKLVPTFGPRRRRPPDPGSIRRLQGPRKSVARDDYIGAEVRTTQWRRALRADGLYATSLAEGERGFVSRRRTFG